MDAARLVASLAAPALLGVAVAGCYVLTDTSGLAGGRAGSSDAGRETADALAADTAVDGVARCPSSHGASMVEVVSIEGVHYCVDSTEATQADYQQFLLDPARDARPQPPECAWNRTFDPSCSKPGTYDPTTKAAHPVSCVDWCDAHAYCAWAGKRLCGKVGGGTWSPDAEPTTTSQWVSACSQNGARSYPYAGSYDPTRCNGSGRGADATVAVASLGSCVGGFDGLFDLSGNVREWTDTCFGATSGGRGNCQVRGGAYSSDPGHLACDQPFYPPPDSTLEDIGFRCCAESLP
ncbi:MAG: hypothetical protein NVSMB47_02680 [Polyangiales bacterium]